MTLKKIFFDLDLESELFHYISNAQVFAIVKIYILYMFTPNTFAANHVNIDMSAILNLASKKNRSTF